MQAFEAGAYSVTDFAKRIDPLRRSEAGLAIKKADAESELNQQAVVITKPQMVLDFAKDVGNFIKHSSAKERKQVLKKFIKTVWVYPGRVKIVYSIPLPRDAGKSGNSETEPGPAKDPVSPSALLSPHRRTGAAAYLHEHHPQFLGAPAHGAGRGACPVAGASRQGGGR